MFRLFFCACLLTVLVKPNPVPQNCPGTCFDQITYRNSLADFSDTIIPSFISPLNQITEYEKRNKFDQIQKLFNDRLANNPSALHFVNNVRGFNNEDILNYIRNSGNIPNIVNNYIFLPTDVKTENDVKPNNVNLESFNKIKRQHDLKKKNTSKQIFDIPCVYTDDIKYEGKVQTENIEPKILEKTIDTNVNHDDKFRKKKEERKTLKRSLEEKSKRTNRDNINSNLNQNERSVKTNSSDDINQGKIMNMEQKTSTQKRRKDKSKQSRDKTLSTINNKENNTKNSQSDKKNNTTQDSGQNLKKTVKKIKNEPDQNKHTSEKNHNKDVIQERGKKNSNHKNKNIQSNNPSVQNDFNDMYKYLDTILSNYQFTNPNFNSGYPFDYNNFYQLSQPTTPWNSINTINNKITPHKHRKLQRLGKRLHKKRSKLKKKQKGKTVDDRTQNLNGDSDLSKDITKLAKMEESASLADKVSKNTNMISLEGPEINSTKLLADSTSNNNSFSKESSNSYPPFIIAMEDTVPIIFEDSFIDDYYPDFTADDKALIMTPEENHAKMYNSDKYRYVSNHNLDLEDYIKKRKELAMRNINTNAKLFFSEKATNEDVMNSGEDVLDNTEGRMMKFQSPPSLDNPDFRTRKIEHEKYEPYYYHNVFHDPDEDFNKYYSEKKEIVYPTSYSLKNDLKNKLCNEIDDSSAKAKWKKIKDTNVETVYANSKLAKYGLVL